jgi:hypothetical protein
VVAITDRQRASATLLPHGTHARRAGTAALFKETEFTGYLRQRRNRQICSRLHYQRFDIDRTLDI